MASPYSITVDARVYVPLPAKCTEESAITTNLDVKHLKLAELRYARKIRISVTQYNLLFAQNNVLCMEYNFLCKQD